MWLFQVLLGSWWTETILPCLKNVCLSLFDFVLQASPDNLFVALPLIQVHPSWSILLQKHYAFYFDIDLFAED